MRFFYFRGRSTETHLKASSLPLLGLFCCFSFSFPSSFSGGYVWMCGGAACELKKKMGRGRKRGRKSCLDSSSSTLKIDTLPPSSHRRPRGCLLLLSNESSHPSFPKEWRKKVVEMFSATDAPPPRDKKTFEYRSRRHFISVILVPFLSTEPGQQPNLIAFLPSPPPLLRSRDALTVPPPLFLFRFML